MPEHGSDASEHRPLVENAGGAGPFVVVCDHASNAIPPGLARLGLAPGDEASHAAWDPGALGVARALSGALDAPLVAAAVSRLVHDVNRPEGSAEAMPKRTETVTIPGNAGLTMAHRAARGRRYYVPFHAAIEEVYAARPKAALVTVHSFTPVWHGTRRAVEIGIVHDSDSRLADAMLARPPAGRRAGRNDPYGPEHGVTHTLRRHGVERGRLNVMLEIRNDLVADAEAEAAMGRMLAEWVAAARADLGQGAGA
ncbi:Predicted N-formylglutamate amidohydrolase [Rhodovulum sp. ES.010]|uniref:N-formylglutamate amidohydrolase n=1 Tax=Rhodovulum sp. ES.010 TaxID=1882821 RepID=UPI00092C532A|nr:N-formylglutamate amidohydrolase [Rhodovulum sp. ES.010]SIO21936.1 Predicted N-formylglutamate amidohydrolase [Rhodovulum sp. ES.010]